MASRRALHFVYKIGDRAATAKFYRDILGMKVRGTSVIKGVGGVIMMCILVLIEPLDVDDNLPRDHQLLYTWYCYIVSIFSV